MIRKKIKIVNKLGLHARAASKFVETASRFSSQIDVIKDTHKKINGKSIMGLMMLAASKGTELVVVTHGEDEQEALKQLALLVENRFGEKE